MYLNSKVVQVNPILDISELVVNAKFTDKPREANSWVKDGYVYINDIRIANLKTLVMIPTRMKMRVKDTEILIEP